MTKLISFIIPTFDRLESLMKTIDCIDNISDFKIDIYIISDGNGNHSNNLFKITDSNLTIFENKERKDWPFSINKILKTITYDIFIPFADDIIFDGNIFKKAIEKYFEYFPELDGVLGLGQDLRSFGMGAFTIFGINYANHFPEKKVYCPDYIHYYSDQEHYLFSNLIGKYQFFEDTKLKHIDRNQFGGFTYKDETNRLAHLVLSRDKAIFEERQSKNYLWGKNFDLIDKCND